MNAKLVNKYCQISVAISAGHTKPMLHKRMSRWTQHRHTANSKRTREHACMACESDTNTAS